MRREDNPGCHLETCFQQSQLAGKAAEDAFPRLFCQGKAVMCRFHFHEYIYFACNFLHACSCHFIIKEYLSLTFSRDFKIAHSTLKKFFDISCTRGLHIYIYSIIIYKQIDRNQAHLIASYKNLTKNSMTICRVAMHQFY